MITIAVPLSIHSELFDAETAEGVPIQIVGFFVTGNEDVSLAVLIPNELGDKKEAYIEGLHHDVVVMLQNFAQLVIDKMQTTIDNGLKQDEKQLLN